MHDSYFHATSVFFDGCGILIVGKSGSGKSSLALMLLEQGALLISDDITCLNVCNGVITASAPVSIRGGLEVRGIGVLSVLPIAAEMPIHVIVELTEQEQERCPTEINVRSLMGVSLPVFQFRMFDFALTSKIVMVIKLLKNDLAFFKSK